MKHISRSLAGVVAGTVLIAAPAFAGDIADFQSLGFSPDGSVYAFEEYGIQDGSGFPYSNIYFIDTKQDQYLPGTPIRVRIDNEEAKLGEARGQAGMKAETLANQYALADNPGQLVAFNPVTETESAPDRLRYRAYAADPAFGEPYKLQLEEFSEAPSPACKDIVSEMKGFRLRLTEREGAPADELVYADDHVPASRGCATGYRLGGVVTHLSQTGQPVHMVLVLVLSYGFEGHDGRWIAVPVHP